MNETLGILKFEHINGYLIGRFMFRLCHRQVPDFFSSFFERNSDIHQHATRAAVHFHLLQVKYDLSKNGIRYQGAIIWTGILQHKVNCDVSEAVFKRILMKIVLYMDIWIHESCRTIAMNTRRHFGCQLLPHSSRMWQVWFFYFVLWFNSCINNGVHKPSRVSLPPFAIWSVGC